MNDRDSHGYTLLHAFVWALLLCAFSLAVTFAASAFLGGGP